jgi:hypothetical protein
MKNSTDDTDKEYEPTNKRIQENCLRILSSAILPTKKLQSSHGNAYYINRNRVEDKKMAIIAADVDSAEYFNELLEH